MDKLDLELENDSNNNKLTDELNMLKNEKIKKENELNQSLNKMNEFKYLLENYTE